MVKGKSASGQSSRRARAGQRATHRSLKEQLILAGKVLVAEGQDDFTRGHISFRLPDDRNLFFMKAHSIGLDEITMQNILTIDLEGAVVAGTARRHSEVYIHSEIFKARPDVNCIIHTHPTYSIALSATGRGLKCYSQPGARELYRHHQSYPLARNGRGSSARSRQWPRGAVEKPRRGSDRRHDCRGCDRDDYAGERRYGAIAGRSGWRSGAGVFAS